MTPFDLVVRLADGATAADVFDCDIGIAGGCIVAPTPRPLNWLSKEPGP